MRPWETVADPSAWGWGRRSKDRERSSYGRLASCRRPGCQLLSLYTGDDELTAIVQDFYTGSHLLF